MTIGTMGTGKMAGTLATLWAAKGHAVMLGSRRPEELKRSLILSDERIHVGTLLDAVAFGNVVLLATPWEAAESAIKSVGSLKDKIVIDRINPIVSNGKGIALALGYTTSAAEQIAQWAVGAKVFKAYNTIHWENLTKPRFGSQVASCFFCGDDGEAKKVVARLIEDSGFEPVDSGPLTSARYLEPLAFLWMQIAFERGSGKDIAIKLLRR
jgi:hypothetical protein